MHFLPSLFLLPYPTHHPVALEGEVERWTNLLYPNPPNPNPNPRRRRRQTKDGGCGRERIGSIAGAKKSVTATPDTTPA